MSGGYSAPRRGEEWFLAELADLKRQIRDLRNANVLLNAAIGPGGRLRLGAGSQIVADPGASMSLLGDLDVQGDASLTGDTTIGGNLAVTGTLSLPAGIIDNDALANPVKAGYASQGEVGWGTSTVNQTRAAVGIAVPAGFSQALVYLTTAAGAVNDTPNADYLFLASSIAGVEAGEMPALAGGNSGFATVTTAKSSLLTGLSGGSVQVAARIHTQGAAWAANGTNRAYVEALAIFLR